ncbi:hypothetical protein AB0K18_19535 [Nonomuraea sp. NPDC049421]|uniref:hypothetical protein n=1 Tax=Nonomuraea sp. NPDC049421 TaxID=3155275 RepID=UPI003431F1D6
MTQPPDEYGDLLRRALRAEADAVVPSPDGLEIIRARIERRGVRNLFWWRAGAAAASAVLVAGAIVFAVPGLRSQIIDQAPVRIVDDETSKVPSNSSTTRSIDPPATSVPPRQSPPAVVIPATPSPTSPKPTRKAESTSRPSQSPTPTPTTTPCPSALAEEAEPPSDCPTLSPSPTPTPSPTMIETSAPPSCPPEQCPPDDEMTETPPVEATPLQDTQTTP